MKFALRIAVAAAALAVLVVPGALAQGGSPTLTEAQDSAFPDRVWIYRTPTQTQLERLVVTENGGPVNGMSVDSGSKASGAILLIDASNSMAGKPINEAMVAARAFLGERKDDLPVAVIAYNSDITILSDFTTDSTELATAVSAPPTTAEGTLIYDALIEAASLAKEAGYDRTTAVLLSDGHRRGVQATREETIQALNDANIRVISVGLQSPEYDAETLRAVAQQTNGTYVESATPEQLAPIFTTIGQQLSNEYVVRYRSLLGPDVKAIVRAVSPGLPPATATYTTPALDLAPQGTFEESWVDGVITSPWLMIFVIVSVLALLAFAIFSAIDVRNRSLRRRMAPVRDRAERGGVAPPSRGGLDDARGHGAQRRQGSAVVAALRDGRRAWWLQPLSRSRSPGGRSSAASCARSAAAICFQSLWALLIGLAAPFMTRFIVSRRVSKMRKAFEEQLADNLDVLAGAMRTGHSTMGALSVMADSSIEPSKTEFRRVLQDEQLGVPIDDALMVMARRMQSYDAEQLALVMKLQREAGGNTAEVLDRVAEVIRGRMELRRLVDVLTAQARISRWILTGLPIFVLHRARRSPAATTSTRCCPRSWARSLLSFGALMVLIGSLWIKQIAKMDV